MSMPNPQSSFDPWEQVDEILARIVPPTFPDQDFPVVAFGAVGDGTTDCYDAFRRAIDACHAAGGGRVVVPAGEYLLDGPIYLKSGVNLHVEAKALIRFGANPEDYLVGDPAKGGCVLVRWEGTRCYNFSPLIYAYRERDIAVTGGGTIDGQAARFWHEWKKRQEPDKARLREMGAKGIPVEERIFGRGYHLRPSLFHPYECENVLVEGVCVKGSPFWTIHPVYCTNVTVRGLFIDAGTTNDDGCDPDSCRDVLVENCRIRTADDNIALKAGRDQDAWGGRPCENVVVRNCTLVYSRANGICIGSEMSGDVRNVFVENCTVHYAREGAVCVKSNTDRGGAVENLFVRDVKADRCGRLILLDTRYKGVDQHEYPSRYRNFHFERITCHEAEEAGIEAIGVDDDQIAEVRFEAITIRHAPQGAHIERGRNVELKEVHVGGESL